MSSCVCHLNDAGEGHFSACWNAPDAVTLGSVDPRVAQAEAYAAAKAADTGERTGVSITQAEAAINAAGWTYQSNNVVSLTVTYLRLVDHHPQYGCHEFVNDGSCIHSDHMMAAGL